VGWRWGRGRGQPVGRPTAAGSLIPFRNSQSCTALSVAGWVCVSVHQRLPHAAAGHSRWCAYGGTAWAGDREHTHTPQV
jgi:hypothetical protein